MKTLHNVHWNHITPPVQWASHEQRPHQAGLAGLSARLMFILVIWDPGVGSACTMAHKMQSTHPERRRLEEGSGEQPYVGLAGHRLHPNIYSGSKGQQRGRQSCSGTPAQGLEGHLEPS